MQSNAARLALQIEAQGDELNDYADEESEYKNYYSDDDDDEYTCGEEHRTEHEGSLQLENDLARAALGDLVKGRSVSSRGTMCSTSKLASHELDLEEEKLLDMLQRRLFQNSSGQHNASSGKQPGSVRSSASSAKLSSQCRGGTRDALQRGPMFKQIQDQQQLIYSLGPAVDPSISPEKVGKMVQRFRLQEEKRTRKLRAKREEAESTEKTGFTYAPALNRKSLKLTDQIPKFLERQRKQQILRKQQADWYKQLQETERTRDRTLDLEAHVKTPCICSCGNTTTSGDCAVALDSSPSRLGGHNRPPLSSSPPGQTHTRSCLRFMEMCSKMNKSFAIQRRKDEMKRSIDDMMAFHEEKKQRQQARAEIARAQETTQTTFTPQINPRSEKIYTEMVRSGRLQSELTERMATQRRAMPSVPSSLNFQPTISKRSKALLQKKNRKASATGPLKAGTSGESDTDDVFFRLHKQQPLRGDSPSKQARADSVSASKRSAVPQVDWNVIAFYHAKHGFILQNFDLKVSSTS